MNRQSKRAAARELGVALSSLQEAIATGRVTWPPTSTEALRQQWIASTKAQGPAPLADRGSNRKAKRKPDPESLADARRRKETALADLRELELRQKSGELVEAKGIETRLVDVFTKCRTKLLGIPSRARQALPHLTVADIGTIEELIREALEDLAGERHTSHPNAGAKRER